MLAIRSTGRRKRLLRKGTTYLLLALGSLATGAGTADSLPSRVPQAAVALDTAHCVDARSLDLRRILPPPPAAGSPRERAELDEMEHIQSLRTEQEVEHAREDATISVFRFATALGGGPHLGAARLPHTLGLFQHLSSDERAVLRPAKREFGRPRPFTVDPRLAPVTARPTSGSYPSGHSLWAYTTALVLADMVPERRAQILARADQYAHERTVAGVHYPSDVEAGRLAGTALAALLFTCPAFEHEEAAARTELRGALRLTLRGAH